MAYSLSGCLDVLTAGIDKLILKKDHNWVLFDLQLSVIKGSGNPAWKQAWKKALNLSSQKFNQLEKIADSKRAETLLLALWAPHIFDLAEQLRTKLQRQTDSSPQLDSNFFERTLVLALDRLPALLYLGEKLDLNDEVGELLLHLLMDEASKLKIPVDYPKLRQTLCGIFEKAEIPVKSEADPIFQKVADYETKLLQQFQEAEQNSDDFLENLNNTLSDFDTQIQLSPDSWKNMEPYFKSSIKNAASQLTDQLIQDFTNPDYKPDNDKNLSQRLIELVYDGAEQSGLEEERDIVIDTLCAIFSRAKIPVEFQGGM